MKGLSGVPDKGVMIELAIDTERITELAPLYRETVIVDGDAEAAIVAPATGEMRDIAEELAEKILQQTGVAIPILDESGFSHATELPCNCIVLGHGACNQLVRRLQYLRYLNLADYTFAGHRVVSVHNPLGDGHNVLCVLGRDADVVRRGADELLRSMVAGEAAMKLPGRIVKSDPPENVPDVDDFLAQARARNAATSHSRPIDFLQALRHLNSTGDEAWARACIEVVTPYATGKIPLSFVLMSAVDFWTNDLVIGWDCAEEFDYFSDDERLLIANFIASCTEYCHDSITYQKWRITDEEHMIFNHHTFPARGLYFGCMYLRRHGYEVVDIDGWLNKARAVFRRAAEAGRSFDEGGAGYSWLVGMHMLEVMFAEGDTSYAESGKIRNYADLAIAIQNSRAELVPFGDCHGYHTSAASAANILSIAAEYHRDPGYLWMIERDSPAAADSVYLADISSAAPDEHLGAFVLPMDPVIHRWIALPSFPNYADPNVKANVPPEDGFDKLALRGGWDEDADYMLLQGFGDGQHGHPDANSISQYQVRGRLFLVDSDYIRRWPKAHNTVMVVRSGQHDVIPATAKLDGVIEFDGGACSQTTLVDYNGCDWTRTVLWLNGDCALVIDSLKAREAGDYEFRAYWRTLGQTDQTDTGLHANHDGEHFRIIELTASERRMDREDLPLNKDSYAPYNFGEAVPVILSETQRLSLDAGEEACFVNLLLPTGQCAEPQRSVSWAGHGIVAVSGEGAHIIVDSAGFTIDGARYSFDEGVALSASTADNEMAARSPLATPDRSSTTLFHAELSSAASAMCRTAAGDILAGCEDGTVALIAADGRISPMCKADARIGAVHAAALYGEDVETFIAASYDQTTRFLNADGSERMTFSMPRNSYIPAWGRAICTADLDGDGKLWPIVGTASWRVHAVAPDASCRWTFDTAAHLVTCLASADLNADGRDEIVVGTVYFCVPAITADGGRLWQDEDYNDYWAAGPDFRFIDIADVDADGRPEVITVASDTLVHCIDNLGEKKWTASIGDDPAGMVITGAGICAAAESGDIHMLSGDGSSIWRLSLGCRCNALARAGALLCVAAEDGAILWLDADGRAVSHAKLAEPASRLLGCDDGTAVAATGRSLIMLKP